jgi:4-amino-4-deoxy-L-arabinose transferase-like glycosyltransferase
MAGLGFLVKGFMVCLPAIALLPYLVLQHRRHHHLFNPGLYLGLVLGAIPPVGWLWVSSWRYGAMPFQELVGKLFLLGTHQWKGTGPLYYLWNIPANAFPWPLFALIGLGLALRHADINRLVRASGHVLLLLGYPVILFVELSLFKTRTQYYPLQLLPFMALLAGVALDWLVSLYANRTSPRRWLSALLTYTFGGLAVLLILAGIAVTVGIPGVELTPEVQHYGAIAFGLGLGWLVLPIVWIGRHWYGKPAFSARHWLAGWLLGPWLALATLGITGVFGNHNPDVKAFLQQPAIASILQTHPIDFVSKNLPDDDAEKTFVLLSFYTPDLGKQVSQVTDLPTSRYAWVGPQHPLTPSTHYRRLGSIRGWQLIQASR